MASKTLQMVITAKNLATKALKDAAGDIEKIDAKMKQNLQTARNWGAVVAGAGAVFAGLATKTFADFESQMSRVSAITQTTGEDFEMLSKQARELGGTTAFTAKQAAEGMTFLGMAGFETDEIMQSLTGTLNLAAAANIELGRSADIASNILTGFRLEAEETDRVVDVLAKTVSSSNVNMEQLGEAMKFFAPTAAAMGISIEEAAATVGLLGNAGLQGSIATRALSAAMTRLASPTSEMKRTMEDLGVEFFNAQGQFVGMEGLVGNLNDSFKGLTQQQQQAALGTLFGTEAVKQFNILLSAGVDELSAFTTELENAQGTAQEMAETQLDNLKGSVIKLNSAFQETQISLGGLISQALRPMVDALTFLLIKFNELHPGIKNAVFIVGGLTTAAIALGAALAALILVKGTLITVVGTMAGVFTVAGTAVAGFVVAASALLIPLAALGAAFAAIAIAQNLYTKGIKEQAAASDEASKRAQEQANIYAQVAASIQGSDKQIFEFKAEMARRTAVIEKERAELQILLAQRAEAFLSELEVRRLNRQIAASEKNIKQMEKEQNEFATLETEKLKDVIKAGRKIIVSREAFEKASTELSEEEFSNRLQLMENFAAENEGLQELILKATGNISKKELEIIRERFNAHGEMAEQFRLNLQDLFDKPIFQTLKVLLPDGEELFDAKVKDQIKKSFQKIDVDFSDIVGPPKGDDGDGGGGGAAEKTADEIEKALDKAEQAYSKLNEQAGKDLRELRETHAENIDAMNMKINDLKGNIGELETAFKIEMGGVTQTIGTEVIKQEQLIAKLADEIIKAEEEVKKIGADAGGDETQKQRADERLAALNEQFKAEEAALAGFFANQNSLFEQQADLVAGIEDQLALGGGDEALQKQLAREQAVLEALTGTVEDNELAIEEARRRAALTEFERFIEDADAKKLRLAQDFVDRKILLEEEIIAIEAQKVVELQAFDEKIAKYEEAAKAFDDLKVTFEDGLDSMAGTAEEKVERINEAIQNLKSSLEFLSGDGGTDLASQLAVLEGVAQPGGAEAPAAVGAGNNTNETNINIGDINISNDVDADQFLGDLAETIQLERQGSQ